MLGLNVTNVHFNFELSVLPGLTCMVYMYVNTVPSVNGILPEYMEGNHLPHLDIKLVNEVIITSTP